MSYSLATTHTTRGATTIAELIKRFGLVPPCDVDLDAVMTHISDDRDSETLAFEARSKDGARTIIVALADRTTLVFFAGSGPYSLSNLPLVGDDLAQAESIQVENFVVNANGSISAAHARLASNAMQALGTGLPALPAGGTTGTTISATMAFGADTIDFTLPPSGSETGSAGGVKMSSTSDGTVWFTIQQTWGSTVMEKIGAKYLAASNSVWFEIDASISVDALLFELEGLGMTLTTTSPVTQSFVLQGAALTFSKSPLTLSGALMNVAPPGSNGVDFEGEVVLGTSAFTAQIAGEYSNDSKPSFPSAFLFADLATKFGGPPSFSVTSAAIGGGFNSALLVPTIDQVSQFPFLQVLSNSSYLSSDPVKALDTMMNSSPKWVTQSDGAWWIAAGIDATSFSMIDTSALLVVEDSSGLVIALIGKSSASFPQGTLQKLIGTYAYVELDLLARFAPSEGVFSAQAQLAKSSFLLSQDCVLTGGFAFFDWFGPSPYAGVSGDFVLTLGGYNPGFVTPSYYPAVPRVGFDWSLDSSISISGDAYFALTPAAFMVGGELKATYESGNLQAWFDAHADVMTCWSPFSFQAGIGINIGASYTLDLLFTTTTVTVELGCDLELWGPPTGGTVSVDWSIISFTIPFGESPNGDPPALEWSDVTKLLPPQPVMITATGGLTQTAAKSAKSTSADDATPAPWLVRAGQFTFNTSSSIPATSYDAGQARNGSGSAPASTFNVALLAGSEWEGVTATHGLAIADSGGNDATQYFSVTPAAQSNVPASLWGAQQSNPPAVPSGNQQLVPNLFTGLAVSANAPTAQNPGAPIPLANLLAGGLQGPGSFGAAPPAVNAPTSSSSAVSSIATTIASPTTVASRTQIFNALGSAAPVTSNDPMTRFANDAGAMFAAEPMLV
jgi:hypothetical protein